MNKKMSKMIDKLLGSSNNKLGLMTIQKLFNSGIPFNLPHKFKFLELSDKKTRLQLPHIRKNQNHLGGIHACAIATLGEYPAGLTLIKKFGSSTYRLIMDEIHVNYLKQAKEALVGEVLVDEEELSRVESELKSENISKITIPTNILNKNNEVVAVVQTTWQLKNWDKVTFKG